MYGLIDVACCKMLYQYTYRTHSKGPWPHCCCCCHLHHSLCVGVYGGTHSSAHVHTPGYMFTHPNGHTSQCTHISLHNPTPSRHLPAMRI